MTTVLSAIGSILWLMLAPGVANMSPILIGDRLRFLATPVDGGRELGGRRLFGAHKTWRGLIVATFMGGIVFVFQQWAEGVFPVFNAIEPIALSSLPWWFGFVLGAAAILGDLIKSFVKRRFGIESGKSWFPFDQLDAIVAAAIVYSLIAPITLTHWVIFIILGLFLHFFSSVFGYIAGLKEHPW